MVVKKDKNDMISLNYYFFIGLKGKFYNFELTLNIFKELKYKILFKIILKKSNYIFETKFLRFKDNISIFFVEFCCYFYLII